LIPDEAITPQQSDQIVYVVGPGHKVLQRKVTTGPLVNGLRAVRGGLNPDDLVIIDGVQKAKVGVVVNDKLGRIVPPNPGASPNPSDLAPPPSAATFADQSH
jgi:multidrug efflux pump subunit AcrA (membrane-fusion protein)